MAPESSLQAVEPSPQTVQRPRPIYPRADVVMVSWFFGWPVIFFTCLPLMTPADTLEACMFGAGSLLWWMSCYWIYGMLFRMAEARWPAATTFRQILSFVVGILQAFRGH